MNRPAAILSDIGPESWDSPGGGYRRSEQIVELLREAGVEVCSVPRRAQISNLGKYWLGARFLIRFGRRGGARWRLVRRHGGVIARLAPALRNHAGDKVLLWQISHPNDLVIPRLAHQAAFSVLALPQNLEALVPSGEPIRSPRLAARFRAELQALAEAEACFCIAREEQWLLALHGIPADCLPYHPPRGAREFLLGVREQRRSTAQGRFLVLGSAGNPPTAAGMTALIRLLQSLPGGRDLPVDIAGYNTEQFRPQLTDCGYQLHGAVDRARLVQLMVQARAFLAYQVAAVGVLTRIPEMLHAGVPVLANPVAARSWVGSPGLHIFESATELAELLARDLPPPEIPAQPVRAERRFIDAVLSAAQPQPRLVTQ